MNSMESSDTNSSVLSAHIRRYSPRLVLAAGALFIAGAVFGATAHASVARGGGEAAAVKQASALEEKVLPKRGVALPARWGSLGKQLLAGGVIDEDKFKAIYEDRGGYTDELDRLLYGDDKGVMVINEDNAAALLNLLWALGLANKNPILTEGEMSDPQYGGAGNFASTGGWTVSRGDAMEHFGAHALVTLTPEQQALVEKLAKGIYRPCCDNSTHFPDCNHGMAMLGLLELMASQGASEQEMWNAALAVNAYWFPDTYLTIAQYLAQQGVEWPYVDAQKVLGKEFSSASGFRQVASQVSAGSSGKGGSGCGLGGPVQESSRRLQSGCGI